LGYNDFRAETPILEGKMPEFAKSDQPSKGGRAPFNPTAKQRDRVALLAAGGIPQPAIAAMLGCCERTLRNHFGAELEMGRGVKRAENLERLEAAAKGGSIGAMKTLEAIFGHAETKQLQGKSKAAPQPSKRVLAQRAAATAGGARTPWGSDLDWSNGGRPQ
jgi:hypothetical protein